MPEIKRTFTAGKMNKDLDERLVKNGEYRDALNIKVRTTDGDYSGVGDAGVVQNLKGNEPHSRAYRTSDYNDWEGGISEAQPTSAIYTKFVGCVSDEKNDKAYFFAAAPLVGTILDIPYTDIMNNQINQAQRTQAWTDNITGNNILNTPDTFIGFGIEDLDDFQPNSDLDSARAASQLYQSNYFLKYWVDSIIEIDATINAEGNIPMEGRGTPIFVDLFGITGRWVDVMHPSPGMGITPPLPTSGFSVLPVFDGSAYRIGMTVYLYNNEGEHQFFDENGEFGVKILDIQDNLLYLSSPQAVDLQQEFDNNNITWQSAFKFIYPERVLEFDYNKLIPNINIIHDSIFYTDGNNEPKKINITRSKKGTIIDAMEDYPNIEQTAESYLEIPKHTKIFVNNTNITGTPEFVLASELEWSLKTSDIKKENVTVIKKAPITAPHLTMRDTTRTSATSFTIENFNMIAEGEITTQFGDIKTITNSVLINIDIRINDVLRFTNADNNLNPAIVTARVTDYESQSDTIELQIIFVSESLSLQEPTNWNVNLEKEDPLFETKFGRVGYRYQYEDNEYSSFSPWSELAFLPSGFLYSAKDGYNEGMSNKVRQLEISDFIPDDSVRPSDVKKIDILWKTTDDQNVYVIKSITRARDSEWDLNDIENTGRLIMTSEMIHRTLSSDQALRNWDNVPKKALTQEITGSRLVYGNYTQGYNIENVVSLKQTILSEAVTFPIPKKSLKSIRNYKWGVVFGDKYGRETPVLAGGAKTNMGGVLSGDVTVEKSLAHLSNRFKVTQSWVNEPEAWMEYAKYYIKETSNEYYNLILDRWYDAGDSTIWLSFPSVDRNKVDEETYLILKNEHGSQSPVVEKARYKILAIENEAPDYIKTDYRTMGKIKISLSGVYGPSGSGTVPIGLIDTLEIRTDPQSWNDQPITRESFKGTPKVRIVAEKASNTSIRAESPWRTVSKIQLPLSEGYAAVAHGCDIAKAWTGAEVNLFASLIILDNTINQANVDNPSDTDSYIQYYMEFRDEVVENKPEFDGRFFVKVSIDDMLSEKVVTQAGNIAYSPLAAYEIGYIASTQFSPAENFSDTVSQLWTSYGGITNGSILDTSVYNSDGDPENQEFLVFTGGATDYEDAVFNGGAVPFFGFSEPRTSNFWNTWYNDPDTPKIFIDEASARHGFNKIVTVPFGGWVLEGGEDAGWFGDIGEFPDMVPSGNGVEYDLPFFIGAIKNNSYITAGPAWGGQMFNGPISVLQPENQIYAKPNELAPLPFDLLAEEGLYRNYHPNGLSQGVAANGTLGQLTLSNVGASPWSGEAGEFKTAMQTPGTFFRFQDDPEQCVYKIIMLHWMLDYNPGDEPDQEWFGTVDIDNISNHTYGTDITNTNDPSAKRSSIITRFVRIDLDTGVEMYDPNYGGQFAGIATGYGGIGINVEDWDPRGTVNHNGTGSMVIQILEQVGANGVIEDGVVTSKACFETEPKENIDIDIYYEASNAIPMKLNTEGNINTFTKPSTNGKLASRVSILPRKYEIMVDGGASPSIPFVENVDLDETARVYSTISNNIIDVRVGWSSPPNNIETIISGFSASNLIEGNNGDNNIFDGNSQSIANGVAIDDLIQFKHPNGLVTQSKILEHMQPVVFEDSDEDIARAMVLSDRWTRFAVVFSSALGGVDSPQFGLIVYQINSLGGANQEIALMTDNIGSEVFGSNLEKGTFLTSVLGPVPVGNNFLIGLGLSKDVEQNYTVEQNFRIVKTTGYYKIDTEVWQYPVELNWFNCYSFGNGVESDRIRDDFNAPQIDNGFKASSTFLDYKEETISSGLIHSSGLYNDTSSVNGLNEFSMAQKITKNLNPVYGSIQALKTRDTDLVTFCEDKILKILANKDAVFNADGNTQLTATNKVLGQTIPFAGDYGISKNPESLAWDQYRMYFTDKQRGAVLRLSQDGLTPISSVGMKTWFRENLSDCNNIVGTFDWLNGEYNVTLDFNEVSQKEPITVSFNEGSKGWVSFKSFIIDCGVSISGKYFTASNNVHKRSLSGGGTHWIYQHGVGARNTFYNDYYNSEIEIVFNDLPSVVKSFHAMNYEGSQSRIIESSNVSTSNTFDVLGNSVPLNNANSDNVFVYGDYYNLEGAQGWYLDYINTDMQSGDIKEFIKKENKWFNRIRNDDSGLTAVEEHVEELFVQGIGFPSLIGATPSSDTETQTEAGIEIFEEPITELGPDSVVYTILYGPISGTYAIQFNSINGETSSSQFLETYSIYVSQNIDGELVEVATNDPFITGLALGYYPAVVVENGNTDNSYNFLIYISQYQNYDNMQETAADFEETYIPPS